MLSEKETAQIFDRMPFAAIVRSLETEKYVAVNRAFEKTTGYSRDDLLGKTPGELRIYPNPQEHERKVLLLTRSGKLYDETIAIKAKSGDVFNATYSAAVIQLDGTGFILVVFRDFVPA